MIGVQRTAGKIYLNNATGDRKTVISRPNTKLSGRRYLYFFRYNANIVLSKNKYVVKVARHK